jgi:hypothetical protein
LFSFSGVDVQYPGAAGMAFCILVLVFAGRIFLGFSLSSLSSKRHHLYNSPSQNILLLLLLLPGRPGIGTPVIFLQQRPVFLCHVLHEHDKAVPVRDQVVEPSKIPVLIISDFDQGVFKKQVAFFQYKGGVEPLLHPG